MFLVATSGLESFFQLVTVLIVFLFVLLICYITTRWIANYQKGMNFSKNIEFIESHRVTANKFLQIVKVGDKYLLIAVCKDTITMLTELQSDQIKLLEQKDVTPLDFKVILEKAKKLTTKK